MAVPHVLAPGLTLLLALAGARAQSAAPHCSELNITSGSECQQFCSGLAPSTSTGHWPVHSGVRTCVCADSDGGSQGIVCYEMETTTPTPLPSTECLNLGVQDEGDCDNYCFRQFPHMSSYVSTTTSGLHSEFQCGCVEPILSRGAVVCSQWSVRGGIVAGIVSGVVFAVGGLASLAVAVFGRAKRRDGESAVWRAV